MNPQNRLAGDSGDPDPIADVTAFFAAAAAAKAEQDAFGARAQDAMKRLAKACYGHDNSQAQTVASCLASIYNGEDARPVRLDEIRWLDWALQRDLVVVLVGTGHAGFKDSDIREAFEKIGGQAAVDWFHWWTCGGPHKAALRRLVVFVKENSNSSSAGTVRNALRSIYNGTTALSVGKLTYLGDELGRDFALVLDGIIGRNSGAVLENDIESAFKSAGLAEALVEDAWPAAKAEIR